MPYKHIALVLSKVERDLRKIQAKKRPSKRRGESRDHYMGRVGVWLAGQKKKAPPKKKVKTERQRRIEQRKKAEKLLGIKRGVKKKKKKK